MAVEDDPVGVAPGPGGEGGVVVVERVVGHHPVVVLGTGLVGVGVAVPVHGRVIVGVEEGLEGGDTGLAPGIRIEVAPHHDVLVVVELALDVGLDHVGLVVPVGSGAAPVEVDAHHLEVLVAGKVDLGPGEVAVSHLAVRPLPVGEDGPAAHHAVGDGVAPRLHHVVELRPEGRVHERAAGGLGAGLVAFCGAELVPGFDLVAEQACLADVLKEADLVLTGEGRIDASTVYGKVPSGVARRARAMGIPVICLAGEVSGSMNTLHGVGITTILSVVRGPANLESCMQNAAALVTEATEEIVRLWLSVRGP